MWPGSLYSAFAVLGLVLLLFSAAVFIVALFLPAQQRNKLLRSLSRKWII
jgi:hypothetical protein